MREKLIELLNEAQEKAYIEADPMKPVAHVFADHLLAAGVIVPPCKIGDDIWWIDHESMTVKRSKGEVAGFAVTKDGLSIIDKAGDMNVIGTTYCFLSKAEAEAKLKRRLEG